MIEALDIRVRGIVQGVGFRPFVYRLARRYIINGWVLNDLDGVFIHAEGEGRLLDEFVTELHTDPPAAAVVREVELKEVPLQDCATFEIRESQMEEADENTLVSADLGICDDCMRELFDPADRRYRYPFINCTNCGPRFTIIGSLPYDRPTTSMSAFAMCGDCAREYADPADRRFHAQPDACFECGPQVSWNVLPGALGVLPEGPSETLSKGPSASSALAEGPETPRFASSPEGEGERTPVREHSGSGAALFNPMNEEDGVQGVSPPSAKAGEAALAEAGGSVQVSAADSAEPAGGREYSDWVFAQAVALLSAGGIVAVKGLGGFHLVCDAGDAAAIAELRKRKRRDGKAFAVMVADAEAARRWCEVSVEEAALLESAARPIVLLRKRADADVAPGLADGLPELGVMLPATPVQALLLHDFAAATGGGMLVMTSGNVHDEPIVVDDAEACEKLAGIADAVLGNNRPILSRYDDSVVRVLNLGGVDKRGEPNLAVQFVRRARGYAPVPVAFPSAGRDGAAGAGNAGSAGRAGGAASTGSAAGAGSAGGAAGAGSAASTGSAAGAAGAESAASTGSAAGAGSAGGAEGAEGTEGTEGAGQSSGDSAAASQPARNGGASPEPASACVVFAAGSEQKSTFAYARDGQAFVSQHIGDMEDADVYDAWLESKARFEKLFGLSPSLLACDKHPEYLASKWARTEALRIGLPLVEVQHHHAHIASVLGEYGLFGPAIGVAFDGTGYGADGAIWGGEVLIANQADYERFANFSYLPMPGGAAAVKHPLRMAYGMLWAFDLLDHPGARAALDALGDQAAICERMIESGLNTPYTSSVGRLFDAVSAVLGICSEPTYEGEPAILLDAACGKGTYVEKGQTLFHISDDVRSRYAVAIAKNGATETSTAHDTSVVLLDAEPTVRAVLDDMAAGVPPAEISRRFHDAMVGAVVQSAELARAMYGISLVALSGGCFMNRYLVEQSTARLGAAGFTVALNASLPPNDGCISYGQAVVAQNGGRSSG